MSLIEGPYRTTPPLRGGMGGRGTADLALKRQANHISPVPGEELGRPGAWPCSGLAFQGSQDFALPGNKGIRLAQPQRFVAVCQNRAAACRAFRAEGIGGTPPITWR